MPLLEDGAASEKSEQQVQCKLMVLEAQYQSYVGAATPLQVMPAKALEGAVDDATPLLNAA